MKKAFTLIELIVGITISMILMVSVGIFVSSGMQNIFVQQKVLENTSNFTSFANQLQTSFNLYNSGSFSPAITSSGIIFKRDVNYGEGGFTYIGTETLSGVYCKADENNPESDPESFETKSLYIKTFIPFEEKGEDIFTNYNQILTASGGTNYTSYQKEHIIKNISGDIVIGKGIFGNKLIEGDLGTNTYLNSPTGLAQDGNILFISDTLNNRILYYDTILKDINILLGESDGLNEPTGLYYNDTEKALYIANSANGEILKYSSKKIISNPILSMSGFTETINEINLSFSGTNIVNLTNLGNWSVTGNSTSPNYLTGSTNDLKYYFITKQAESVQATCLGTEIKFLNGKPSIYCTKAGSGQTANYPTSTISTIDISNLSGLTNTGSYYVNLKLFNGTTSKYSEYLPYFTQGDNDLTTPEDNTLEIIRSGLNYPTGIWGTGNSDFNQFGDGNYSNIPYGLSDRLLGVPINSLNISNNSNILLSFVLKYYKKYNCYNLDEKTERTFIMNKNLK